MTRESNRSEVSLLSKLAYGMGDVGCNFSWMFVGNFLMIFYTDVFGIGMSAVATLMLVSRFWDAVNDPIIGALSDKTRTRWGRYRPWLLFSAPLTALVLALTFWAHPAWSQSAKIVYMAVTYSILVLGYTCVNIPYGTLCGAMTQNIDERAQLNTSRSVSAMIAIGVINIVTIPLIGFFGGGSAQHGYLLTAVLYGAILAACHIFCFAKTKEVVEIPPQRKLPLRVQLRAVAKNRPYLLALLGQVLFGFILYGRNADMLYYFTYVEGSATLFSLYSLAIIGPSILGAACFPPVFRRTSNKGWAASVFALGTGATMIALYFFSPNTSPILFYLFAALSQFFFSGFNTGHLRHHPRLRGIRRMGHGGAQRRIPIRLHLAGQQDRHGAGHLAAGAGAGRGRLRLQRRAEPRRPLDHAARLQHHPGRALARDGRRPALLPPRQAHLQPHRGGDSTASAQRNG